MKRISRFGILVALVGVAVVSPSQAGAGQHIERQSSITPKRVLSKIYSALPPGQGPQAGTPGCSGLPGPCHHYYVHPTSAFLRPSKGGFTTNCKNTNSDEFRLYKISTKGQTFKTCGPLWPRNHKSKVDEFTKPLNKLGKLIVGSVGHSTRGVTLGVGGNRGKIEATISCRGNQATAGRIISKVVIRRSGRAMLTMCATAKVASIVPTPPLARSTVEPASSPRVIHRHTKMYPQKVLNKIHDAIPSRDFIQDHKRVKPTSASLTASTGEFKTDCSNTLASTYRHFKMTPLGAGYATCPLGPVNINPIKGSTIGQFQKSLNRTGKQMSVSVHLGKPPGEVSRVGGNRKKVTAIFKCPTDSPSVRSEVSKVVIRQSGRATLTECPKVEAKTSAFRNDVTTRTTPWPVLPSYVARAARPLAKEIVKDFRNAKPKIRERRTYHVNGYRKPATELDVGFQTKSTLSHKPAT